MIMLERLSFPIWMRLLSFHWLGRVDELTLRCWRWPFEIGGISVGTESEYAPEGSGEYYHCDCGCDCERMRRCVLCSHDMLLPQRDWNGWRYWMRASRISTGARDAWVHLLCARLDIIWLFWVFRINFFPLRLCSLLLIVHCFDRVPHLRQLRSLLLCVCTSHFCCVNISSMVMLLFIVPLGMVMQTLLLHFLVMVWILTLLKG